MHLAVFELMVRWGSRERVSRELGYHPKTLTKLAGRDATLWFALEAGKYLHESRRAQRVARGGRAR